MKATRVGSRRFRTAPILLLALLFASPVLAGELLFSQQSDGQSNYGPSSRAPAGPVDAEVADDFDLSAAVDRVVAYGFLWGPTDDFEGVYVRFYAFGGDGKPGALQSERYLAAGDPNLVNGLGGFGEFVDITLAPPFAATGKHFVAVQPVLTTSWYRWSSGTDSPNGSPFYFRDPGSGVPDWQQGDGLNPNSNADVAFALYGTVTGAGHIDSLSVDTLPRSGYLEIFGTNFGGDGDVAIGGLAAPVAFWGPTRIVAYVPEISALGAVDVKVTNGTGQPSNSLPLTVVDRQADGRVKWRFRMNGPYAQVRPVIAPDGTVYAIDAYQHLYALSPDGGLKWLVRGAGEKGVAVGADGSIYVGSESAIRAFHPDGSEKWTFVQDPRAFILIGVSVGPDGNVYGVASEGMGVFSLTPEGSLRWQTPEPYDRLIVDYNEIVFGDNAGTPQLYFFANRHLRALTLDGDSVFTIETGLAALQRAGSPAIGPDGSVHTAIQARTPDGGLLWTFATPYPFNAFSKSSVGSDGVHYVVQNLGRLFALGPGGELLWQVQLGDSVDGPIVDPTNSQIVMRGADTLDHPGLILSASTEGGQELWRVVLPVEDPTVWNPATGQYGFHQFVDTRARFTDDGLVAYLVTATATGDNDTSKSFVYAVDASADAPLPPDPIPSILGITPPSGSSNGGGAIAIHGTNYVAGATVTIGGMGAGASVLDGGTIEATAPALAPGTLNDVTVTNPDSHFATVEQAWLADFLDVPQADAFHPYVEKIFRLGITAGCGGGFFCRDGAVSRAQMAVFLLKAGYGSSYTPPACAGIFADVACPSLFADWIEQLAAEGITGGCGGGQYCPAEPVTRAQMAVFLLKSTHGPAYAPPACAGVFADVACPSLFADWIEQLAAEGITGGCGSGNFCPDKPGTRGQMAVFLSKAFQLP